MNDLPSGIEEELDSITQQIISDIYHGHDTLNQRYIDSISRLFENAVIKEFGSIQIDLESKDQDFIDAVKDNIYKFVEGKNKALNVTLQGLLLDEHDNVKPFSIFKQEAEKAGLLFNRTYLKTEYNTAILQAQNIVDWNGFEDDDLLRFDAVLDARTEKLDRSLNGIILPKSDPFWGYASPQLHYGCRCRLLVVNEKASKLTKAKRTSVKNQIPIGFRDNVGITGNIFPTNHPYLKRTKMIDRSDLINYSPDPSIVIFSSKEGGYWGYSQRYPGAVSQGSSIEQLIERVKNAERLVIRYMAHNPIIPIV